MLRLGGVARWAAGDLVELIFRVTPCTEFANSQTTAAAGPAVLPTDPVICQSTTGKLFLGVGMWTAGHVAFWACGKNVLAGSGDLV